LRLPPTLRPVNGGAGTHENILCGKSVADLVPEERDLAAVAEPEPLPAPEAWRSFPDGTPQPDWTTIVRRSRGGH